MMKCPRCGRAPWIRRDRRRECWVAVCRSWTGRAHVKAASPTALELPAAWNEAARNAGKRGGRK